MGPTIYVIKWSLKSILGWCWEIGTFLHYWWEYKTVQMLWKTVWQSLKILNIKLPHDLAIPLLDSIQEKGKHTSNIKTCMQMFIIHYLQQTKSGVGKTYPSTDKWIYKMGKWNKIQNKNKVMIHLYNVDDSWKQLNERSTKDYMLCDSIYMKSPE